MLVSPFTFYRGGAYVMASDLSHTPVSGLSVQLCGDAHLSNFGGFASPERRMVFDINDFDETLPGPWEFDAKRLAASFEIAGRDLGFSTKQRRRAVTEVARSYRKAMSSLATMGDLEVWYSRFDAEKQLPKLERRVGAKRAAAIERNEAKAEAKDSMKAFAKLTHVVDGRPKILSDPPLVVPVAELLPEMQASELDAWIRRLIRQYRATLQDDHRLLAERFEMADIARKVVGVGSVGTRAFILLMLGRDDQDPLFLQVKEANASVLERFVGASAFENHGRRVVAGQRLMQASSDIFWDGSMRQDMTAWTASSMSASCGTGRHPPRSRRSIRPCCWPTRRSAAGRWRAHMPGRETVSRLPPISAPATHLTRRSRTFRLPTPTKTKPTIKRSKLPSTAGA